MKSKRMIAGAMALATAAGFAVAASIALLGQPALAKTELLVYTAVEADELSKFKKAFEKDNPDIEIKWVRDSTGIMGAKLLAEKDNPKADIVWGMAATVLLQLLKEDYFQAYAPAGVKKLNPLYVDPKNDPPLWVGQRAYVASVCYNTVEAKKHNLPKPASWKDLTKPVYKGHVIMPNPASSGTGFLDVSSWMQMWGEDDAWKFMDGLHENIARYTHSGSKPCKLAAAGEIPIGVSFAYRVVKSKAAGAPLEIVIPSEGIGWEVEAFAIVKNTGNLGAARKLADWTVSNKSMVLHAPGYAEVALPGVPNPVADFPNVGSKMINNDFAWAGENKKRIVDEWTKRYDSKSEPKG
jgi:iron(III) transport system substrate-binding protein